MTAERLLEILKEKGGRIVASQDAYETINMEAMPPAAERDSVGRLRFIDMRVLGVKVDWERI